jgi:4-carboxymuconolactone decarboxylase
MKYVLALAAFVVGTALPGQALAQQGDIFPRGEAAPPVNHTGTVWLNEVSEADETFNYNVAVATFAPGASLNWHTHPGGQILMITQGRGYYQERGKPVQTVRQGDVIRCLPGVDHWHGATPSDTFAYIGITMNNPKGRTIWLEKLSDDDYARAASSSGASANNTAADEELLKLSRDKWTWMAQRNVDALSALFHEEAVFVHMGATMTRDQELNVIRGGGIVYKQADIHEASVRFIGNTAIVLNRITLVAVVGGNEVTNPFMVTEVYVQQGGTWKLGSLSFTRLLTP